MTKVRYDDLEKIVGQTFGPSEWMPIAQDKIEQYGQSVEDTFWIHTDVERATKAFGGTIVHGLLSLSMMPFLGRDLLEVTDHSTDLNYGYDRVRFLSVVHGGERVRLSFKVASVEPRGEGLILRRACTVEVESATGVKPALVADWLLLLFPDPKNLASQAKLATAQA